MHPLPWHNVRFSRWVRYSQADSQAFKYIFIQAVHALRGSNCTSFSSTAAATVMDAGVLCQEAILSDRQIWVGNPTLVSPPQKSVGSCGDVANRSQANRLSLHQPVLPFQDVSQPSCRGQFVALSFFRRHNHFFRSRCPIQHPRRSPRLVLALPLIDLLAKRLC